MPESMADVCEEGLRIVEAAAREGLPVRLVGGVAVWARSPSARLPGLRRSYGDVDLVSRSGVRHELTDFLVGLGYTADRMFNALHGAQRLNFVDEARDRALDVILDSFSMCHAIELADRLELEPVTIPLADLLLTKLQVVELNDKDIRDLIALLADHPLEGGVGAGEALDVERITSLLGGDWGFEHTARGTLARVREAVSSYDIPSELQTTVASRAGGLIDALDRGAKTVKWKLRARLGERVRWYEMPEDARR